MICTCHIDRMMPLMANVVEILVSFMSLSIPQLHYDSNKYML